jgi:predicted  nucleic acid-binding Zn-ribbon protein
MEKKINYLSDLEFNLDTWKRELKFHRDEMDSFQEKLEEVAKRKDLDRDALAKLERFQNKIMRERKVISDLLHKIKEKKLNVKTADINEPLDGRLYREQKPLREEMRTYIRLHYDFKEEMMDFFTEWLEH